MDRATSFRASLDPSDLFAADAHGMRACQCLIRAVTAGEGGRYAEQKTLIAEAADQFARALSAINPATAQPIERTA